MDYNNIKLISQLKNISRNLGKEKEFSTSTRRRWESKTKEAFEVLGIDPYNYLNKKTEKAKQQALIKASNTLTKKLIAYDKKVAKDVNKLRKTAMKKAKENLKESSLNERTKNVLAQRGHLPEKADIENMNYDQLHESIKLMDIPQEERAKNYIDDYAQEFFNRYFRGIVDEEGIQDRLNKLIESFGYDYVKAKDMIERTQEAAFKGGYGDTNELLTSNSDFTPEGIMYDRLSRLENEYLSKEDTEGK